MDLSTGEIQIADKEFTPLQNIPTENANRQLGISKGARYNRNGLWSDVPWSADSALVSLVEGPDSTSLILEIEKSKEDNSITKVRLKHNAVGQPPFVTGDGRYVLLQSRDDEWAAYSSIDGRQIGRFSATNVAEPYVEGDRVYYLTEQLSRASTDSKRSRMLIAQNISTGKIEWTHTLAAIHSRNRPKLPQ
jgi:outer membrane protein assembly factor BamB